MVFNFNDTPSFLKAYIESLPKKGWGEVQRWATHLDVQSSYVSQALTGKRSLNVDQGIKLAQVIGLKGLELDYFILLIEKEKAGATEAKNYFTFKLGAVKKEATNLAKIVPRDKTLSETEKSVFYSSWIYSAIRLFCSLGEGKSIEEITARFSMRKDEAAEALQFLTRTGLLILSKNLYNPGARKTHLERESPYLARHRMNWHVKALTQLDRVREEELVYSAPFSISQKDFDKLKRELAAFVKSFVERVEKTEVEKMALLNIDLLFLS
jgi:uncharacterized protein (TIGR02147 family)